MPDEITSDPSSDMDALSPTFPAITSLTVREAVVEGERRDRMLF